MNHCWFWNILGGHLERQRDFLFRLGSWLDFDFPIYVGWVEILLVVMMLRLGFLRLYLNLRCWLGFRHELWKISDLASDWVANQGAWNEILPETPFRVQLHFHPFDFCNFDPIAVCNCLTLDDQNWFSSGTGPSWHLERLFMAPDCIIVDENGDAARVAVISVGRNDFLRSKDEFITEN